MKLVNSVLDIVKTYGITGLVIVILLGVIIFLFRILMDEDRSSLWRARIYLAVYKILGQQEAEKKYIANDVRGRINFARRNLYHGKSILPEAVAVDWVDEGAGGSYQIREGEFVVRLRHGDEQDKNIVDLAMAVVSRSTLLGVRHVMGRPLKVAVDFCLVQNILRIIGHKQALEWFFSNQFRPITEKDNEVSHECERISEIDERGLFTKILLIELEEFAGCILGKQPRPYMIGEIEGMVDFLYRIATKQLGQDIPLDYNRAYIKIGVILVARTSRILRDGVDPYLKVMARNARRGLNTVYVICYEKELLAEVDPNAYENFRALVRDLDDEILKSIHVRKDFSLDYVCIDQNGNRRKATCSRYILKEPSVKT